MYWNNSAPPATAMLAASTTSRTGRAVVMTSGSMFPSPAVFQMRPHVPNGAADDDSDDNAVETMHEGLEAGIGVPALSELLANIGESIAPGPGAQERIELELSLRHARDACGERDEGADHRQQPADDEGRDGCDDAFEQGNSRGAGRRRSGGPRYSPNRRARVL